MTSTHLAYIISNVLIAKLFPSINRMEQQPLYYVCGILGVLHVFIMCITHVLATHITPKCSFTCVLQYSHL